MPSECGRPVPEGAGRFVSEGIRVLIAALVTVALTGAVAAQGGPEAEQHLAQLAVECDQQLGLDTAKCACVVDDVRKELLPIEIEYAVVRIAENEAEITRLREVLPLGQRLGILFRIIGIVDDCADGAPYNNPI